MSVTAASIVCVQEEEIPELEIDIDELLELKDEEQRSRLHVRSHQKPLCINMLS